MTASGDSMTSHRTSRVYCDALGDFRQLVALATPDCELIVRRSELLTEERSRQLRRLCVQLRCRWVAQLTLSAYTMLRSEHCSQTLAPDAWWLIVDGRIEAARALLGEPLPWTLLVTLERNRPAVRNAADWVRLAKSFPGQTLAVNVRPGDDPPPLCDVAGLLMQLVLSGYDLHVSRLVPDCARPRQAPLEPLMRVDGPGELAHPVGCDACAQRTNCPGLAPRWREARSANFSPATARLLDPDGHPRAAGSMEAVELLALRAGLRALWRLDLANGDAFETAGIFADAQAGYGPLAGSTLRSRLGQRYRETESDWFDFDAAGALADRQLVYIALDAAHAEEADANERRTAARRQRTRTGSSLPGDEAAQDADDRRLGELLGYPTCCIQFLIDGHRHWHEDGQDELAETAFFALAAARRSKRLDWRLDPTTPLHDSVWLRHYPCRFDCPQSLDLQSQLEALWPQGAVRARAARPNAVLLFADGTSVPMRGVVEANRLERPTLVPVLGTGNRARRARAAGERLGAQLARATSLEALPIVGPGGVRVWSDSERWHWLNLHDQPSHPDFPRLLLFGPAPV